jgi:hypothetical protein
MPTSDISPHRTTLALVVALSLPVAASGGTITILQDGFETYAGDPSSSYGGSGDYDPGTPPLGGPWDTYEGYIRLVRVINPPFPLGSYQFDPPAGGGDQYLELQRGSDAIGPEAWTPIAASNQSLMVSGQALILQAKTLNVYGDGYGEGLRIVGYDSAVTNYGNPVFDVRYEIQKSSTGKIQYSTDGTTNVASVMDSGLTYDANAWEDLTIRVDFLHSTYKITVDGASSANIPLITSATKMQSLAIMLRNDVMSTLTSYDMRAFVDNLTLDVEPMPPSGTVMKIQ